MTRPVATVREARPADMPALVTLWGELRGEGFRVPGRGRPAETAEQVEARFAAALDDPSRRLVVVASDEEIVGMALFSQPPRNPLYDLHAVDVSGVCVADGHRRKGIGKLLMSAAVAYAEEVGTDNIMVAVMPQHRDANRFYARLGFAPLVTRRVASVSALRRRLAPGEATSAVVGRRDLVPRRVALIRRRTAATTRDR